MSQRNVTQFKQSAEAKLRQTLKYRSAGWVTLAFTQVALAYELVLACDALDYTTQCWQLNFIPVDTDERENSLFIRKSEFKDIYFELCNA
jgi:hypothetical protein